jgi:glutaredoxin
MATYTVYGAEFCPRCEKAVEVLEAGGATVNKVDLEEIIEPSDDWPERAKVQVDVMADHAMRNMEMPSIFSVDDGVFVEYDEVVGVV